MAKNKNVDLEARFIKKFSATILVTTLNTSPTLSQIISKELNEALNEVHEEMQAEGKKARAIVPTNSDEVLDALAAAPADQSLHRNLHRQSRFFNEIKCMSFTFDSKGAPQINIHLEESPPLSTARMASPSDLDVHNKYVLLHMLPHIVNEWRKSVADDSYQRVHKMVEEVVMDKIGGLREARQTQEEVLD